MKVTAKHIDFASNDYLGFARNNELKKRFLQEMESISQLGATGSRLLTGNSEYAERLEETIAAYHGEEEALLFPSGYCANLGLLSGLIKRDHVVFYDEKVHASIRDGIILSRARGYAFRHNDLNHLSHLFLKLNKPSIVIVESLYSTDGSLAPLKELAHLAEKYPLSLIVDEAHATGVFGPGLVSKTRIPTCARIHTFGKALGVQGGIVLGGKRLKEHLINFSRPFIYTTGLCFPNLAAIHVAYQLIKKTRHALLDLCHSVGSPTPIIPIHIGDAKKVRRVASEMQKEGFDVRPLLYPTVPRGEELLRICLHTYNSKEEINALFASLDHHRD